MSSEKFEETVFGFLDKTEGNDKEFCMNRWLKLTSQM